MATKETNKKISSIKHNKNIILEQNGKIFRKLPTRYLILSITTILFVILSTIFGFIDSPFFTRFRLSTPLLIMEMVFGTFAIIGVSIQTICLYKNKKKLLYHLIAFGVTIPVIFLNVFGFIAVPMLVASIILVNKQGSKKLLLPLATGFSILIAPIGALVTLLSWAAATSFNKDETTSFEIQSSKTAERHRIVPSGQELSMLTWNLGYASTGSEMDYFYDKDYNGVNGTKGKAWSHNQVQGHMDGILKFLKATQGGSLQHIEDANYVKGDKLTTLNFNKTVDFMFLQEVDRPSVRSMYFDEVSMVAKALPDFDAEFVNNMRVGLLPAPMMDPNGQVDAGVMTLSKYNIDHSKAKRISLNSVGTGVDAIFNLKRAIGYTEYKTDNNKTLHMLNIHTSAFPDDKEKRNKEYNTVITLINKWKNTGDYVIIGGDWNSDITDQYFYEKLQTGVNSETETKMKINDLNNNGFLGIKKRTLSKNKKDFMNLSSLNQFDIAKYTDTFRNGIANTGYKMITDMKRNHPTMRIAATKWTGYKAKKDKKVDFAIIDGFLVSKNVDATAETIQQGWHKNAMNPEHPYAFADSDHNPVIMNFRLK